jgi:hypothetical protein
MRGPRGKEWVVRCGGVPECGYRLLVGRDDPLRIHAATALHGQLCPGGHPTVIRELAMEDLAATVHELQ